MSGSFSPVTSMGRPARRASSEKRQAARSSSVVGRPRRTASALVVVQKQSTLQTKGGSQLPVHKGQGVVGAMDWDQADAGSPQLVPEHRLQDGDVVGSLHEQDEPGELQ
jgi:hypothetical protein